MERLTYRSHKFNNPVSHGACKDITCYAKCDSCKINDLIAKLCAYEDTGLEPEGIADAVTAAKLMAKSKIVSCFGVDAEHIRDLIQAEQEGRLVVLPPCTVVCGTTIWWADSNFHTDPIKCEVSSFGIYTGPDGDLQVWMNCYVYGSTPMSQSFRMSSIGKTVFLTREEAEAAIKEDTYHA